MAKYDRSGRREPEIIYLAKPGKKLVCALNGVDPTSVNVYRQGNNAYELSFDVYRYLDGEPSNGYEMVDEGMLLYVDGVWYVITEYPEMENDEIKEYKTVQANSLDITLQQYDLETFNINNGEASSYEKMYKDKKDKEAKEKHEAGEITDTELQDILDTYYQVKFHDVENPDLSLVDIILKHADVPMWKVGYVDDITPNIVEKIDADGNVTKEAKFLSDEIYMFGEASIDVYAFLTQQVSSAYKCIVDFDTVNMEVNFYRIETIGKDTNIYLGYQNLQNKITVSSDNELCTCYTVHGKDNLNIAYANFGELQIEDISHFLNTNYMTQELIDKYNGWLEYREAMRPEYIQLSREYNAFQETIDDLMYRVPDDSLKNDWTKASVEDLQESYNTYTGILGQLENMYVDEEGNFDLDALKASPDWVYYESLQNYTLPSIVAALQAKGSPLPNYGQGNFFKNVNPVVLGSTWTSINSNAITDTFDLTDSPCYGLTKGIKSSIAVSSESEIIGFSQNNITVTEGQQYTVSAYVKNISNIESINIEYGIPNYERQVVNFNVTEGSTGWSRIYYTITSPSKVIDIAFTATTQTGTGTACWAIAGMQMEIGSSCTSFGYYAGTETDTIMAFETDWKLFGTVELGIKLKSYNDSIAILEQSNYQYNQFESYMNIEEEYFYQKHQQYLDYVRLRDECQQALNERNKELEDANAYHERIDAERKEIQTLVSKENYTGKQRSHVVVNTDDEYILCDEDENLFLTETKTITDDDLENKIFTEEDLALLKTFIKHKDYTNENILTTSIDNTVDHVDRQWELYQDALESIYVDAHRQYTYTDEVENIYALSEYQDFAAELDIWNYIRIAVRDNEFVKLRVIGITYNPCTWDMNMELTFSNMIQYKAKRNDFNTLLDSMNSAQKNNASFSGSNNSTDSFIITADLVKSLLRNPTFGGYIDSATFQTITATSISTDKLVASLIKADEGQFETLTADTAFMTYMEAELVSADKIVTKLFQADETLIRNLIATRISVADLMTHTASAQQIILISKDANPTIAFVDSTQQFYDSDGNVRVQIGQDGNGDFNFIVRGEDGATALFDSTGIKKEAIPEGTIINNMIEDGAIDKIKLNSSAITSANYLEGILDGDGAGYSIVGTFLDLDNGMIHMPGLYSDSSGNLFMKGEVTATSGTIGGCSIVDNVLQIEAANINSVNSSSIVADYLSAISSNLGHITAGSMESEDYSFESEYDVLCADEDFLISDEDGNVISIDSGIPYADSGMKISLQDAYIRTPTAYIGGDNAYLRVTLEVSKGSTIAGFKIDDTFMYTNGHSVYNSPVDGIYIGNDYLSLGSGGMTYFKHDGTGKIGAFNVTGSYFANGTTTLAGAANSVYLGTDGISCGNAFKVTNGGVLTATNSTITGLTATSANIVGNINATSIKANASYSIFLPGYSVIDVIKSENYYSDSGWYYLNIGVVADGAPHISFIRSGISTKINSIHFMNTSAFYMSGIGYFNGVTSFGGINVTGGDISADGVYLKSHSHNAIWYGNEGVKITSAGNFKPCLTGNNDNCDNIIPNGTTSSRWTRVYAAKSTISTSDKNEKELIQDIDQRYENLFMKLRPVNYMWKQLYEYDHHDRVHCGLIAQEVNQAALDVGLSSQTFAAICRDELDNPLEDGRIERWGLAYTEFIPLSIHMTQKNTNDIESLKERLDKVENENIELRNEIKQLRSSMA